MYVLFILEGNVVPQWVFKLNSVPAAAGTFDLKGSIPKVKCFSVFVSWCCSLADGVEGWVSSGSGILTFVNTDGLICGDQLTEAKTEESVQSHIGATYKGMC
jgi:hypothetical protein